jgi:hypothetical protein
MKKIFCLKCCIRCDCIRNSIFVSAINKHQGQYIMQYKEHISKIYFPTFVLYHGSLLETSEVSKNCVSAVLETTINGVQ